MTLEIGKGEAERLGRIRPGDLRRSLEVGLARATHRNPRRLRSESRVKHAAQRVSIQFAGQQINE